MSDLALSNSGNISRAEKSAGSISDESRIAWGLPEGKCQRRRGNPTQWVFAVALVGFASGAGLLAWQLTQLRHDGSASGSAMILGVSAVCFALSASSGLLLMGWVRRDCNRLTQRLRTAELPPAESARRLPPAGFVFLQRALAELAESAERATSDAAHQTRQLQVQLKVATAQRQHAQAIIHSISDAVLVTDSFEEVVLANDAAARTFGFDLQRANRQSIDQVLRDTTLIGLIRHALRGQSDHSRRVFEHTLDTSSGQRTFKVTLSAVAGFHANSPTGHSPTGDSPAVAPASPGGVVAVLHDMTREKEVAEMKNDFVSMVSHELRTPLASIKAYVEMLIDGEARDEKSQAEFYEVIQNEANRLSRLIDNILSIARIESGLVRVQRQPQSLSIIVKDALEVITPQAKQKRISVSEKLTPIFYQTLADRDMLHQAVLNLLSNAVKYTPVGGSVCAEVDVNEAAKRVIVRIIDTGVGIPPKDLPFVFDKFYRSEANSRMASGTGLGLSLVKHIIETVHQGKMILESQVGKGSVFGFELDLCE